MLQLEIALMATSWAHLAIMAASLATQVTLLANLEGHLASPKVCLGTFLGLLHRLGTRLGLAILAATLLGLAWLSKWLYSRKFHRPVFLEKKIRGTRQTANYLHIFYSSPKHLPKVRSRGLDHSDKCFFHVIFHVVLQNKCRKNGYFQNPRLFLLIANICGTYQGILNFKTSRNISLE